MITRHHIVLALLCALIASSSLLFSSPVSVIIISAGTGIGSFLPDIHMSRPRRSLFLVPAWLIVQIPRQFCISILCRIYAALGYPVEDPADKRLTHSLPGILFIGLCAAMVLSPLVLLAPPAAAGGTVLFLCGLFLGMGLHLSEDLCTRKGIFPLFPFSPAKVAGSIRPCDTADPRITWYHLLHVLVLIFVLVMDTSSILPPFLLVPVSIAGVVLCAGTMIVSSDVTFREDPGMAGRVVPSLSQSPDRL
ncbi:metal-dependent hydrolase [Methanoregula sp.]|uniref:metal-dependent hydrolase n=1 Tax=Methanoregula sp. TaxID=2052170 RepID=UPI002C32359C|nr:metal-dependent hydrolase [Methanoregula sp.]HVP95940.1 metal-dependent hydrolase [Methanoregula sp.]